MARFGEDFRAHAAAAAGADDDDVGFDGGGLVDGGVELQESKAFGTAGVPVDGHVGEAGDGAEKGAGLQPDYFGDDGESLEEDAGSAEPGGGPAAEDGFPDVEGLVLNWGCIAG